MCSYNHGRFQQLTSFLRRQFLQDGDLPFTDVLSEWIIAHAQAARCRLSLSVQKTL
jgi:hypothetical protein